MPVSPDRVVAVIPARLASTRLPRKVLREVAGQPLLSWVVRNALRWQEIGRVVVAADSKEVAELCAARGWECLMTSPELPSGSDRLFAVSREIDADIYINIQADEPLMSDVHIRELLLPFRNPDVGITTLKVACREEDVANPNVVKVVTAPTGRALYFSRATIPFNRDNQPTIYWKHLGLYAYRKAALERFAALPPGQLEQTERLEQLRLLENGIDIYVANGFFDTIGVDTEEDLQRVDALLRETSRGRVSGELDRVDGDRDPAVIRSCPDVSE
ncbi:MAG TPA: 3-deoxy-manno-octulosonate cytidylyltransferase [Acidobacteriaceae bacterium]|nr:3-deoxy-manno-octulosonate cytidylyltransferase [Acidobacteriaceae bacterium]